MIAQSLLFYNHIILQIWWYDSILLQLQVYIMDNLLVSQELHTYIIIIPTTSLLVLASSIISSTTSCIHWLGGMASIFPTPSSYHELFVS